MTIPLDGTGGLFTRLGQIGQLWLAEAGELAQAAQALGDRIDDIAAQYQSSNQGLTSGLYAARDSYRSAGGTLFDYLQTLAQSTLIAMANDSQPLQSLSLQNGLALLIDEMRENSDLLDAPAVSASAPTYAGYNVGDGALVVSVLSSEGAAQNYVLDETIRAVCTGEVASGSTQYNEPFTVTSPAGVSNTAWNWPQGSGVSTTLNSVNPQADASQGNILTNSDFNTFTADTPDSWTAASGTPGTDFLGGGSGAAYAGDNCLEFDYNAGTGTPELRQAWTGATAATAVAVSVMLKKSAGLSGAGALRIALVDGSGNVLTDPQGNPCSTTVTLASLTTSYARTTLVTWTPKILPASGVYFSLKITTAIADSGESIYVDWMAATALTQLYTGGPYAAIFSGVTPWEIDDTAECAINNDYSGELLHFCDRVFDLRTLELDIPAGAATVSDDLIAIAPAYALAGQVAPKNWNNDTPDTGAVDMDLWDEVWFILMLGPTGSIDSTVAFKLQSDDNSGFSTPSDISGKAIAGFTGTDDGKAAIVKLTAAECPERYARGLATVGNGTTNIIAVAAVGVKPRTTPASNIAAVTEVVS